MSRQTFATAKAAALEAAVLAPAGPAVRIPDRIVNDVLMLIDVGLVVAAAALAKLVYIAIFLVSEQDLQPYLVAGLAGGLVTHYVLRSWGLHGAAAVLTWKTRFGALMGSVGLAFLGLIAIAFLLKVSADYSRGWLITWFGLTILMLAVGRIATSRALAWLAAGGYTVRRVAIVASGAAGQRIADSLRDAPGTSIVGIFEDSDNAPGSTGRPSIADLIGLGQRNGIDQVILDLSQASEAGTARLLDALSVLPVDVWLCPSGIDVPVLDTARVGPINLLQIKPKPIRDWGALTKMALDYVAGTAALILFAPLMVLIAIAIKLDSPGAVFFRQRRHGYNHRVIDVFKFRTMHVAENGDTIVQAKRNDPRVTRVGRFLRKTSLDELPQLINVLRGEMSLVGPRPHALAHNKLYADRLERYANRHCVKPGITGWAQIHGFRGPTEDAEKMAKRVQFDLYYIENWSPWMDIKILAMTPLLGFVNRNAL